MILLDTNAVLYQLHGKLERPLPTEGLHLSIISEIELLGFPGIQPAEVATIRGFLSRARVLDLDQPIKDEAN